MSRSALTPIVLPADPAVAMEAATKQYVDAGLGNAWQFDTTTGATNAVPAGKIRYFASTAAASSYIGIAKTNANGIDVSATLSRIARGTILVLRSATVVHSFAVQGDATNYTTNYEWSVTPLTTTGTMASNALINVDTGYDVRYNYLEELADVQLGTLNTGEALVWNAGLAAWVDGTPTGANGMTFNYNTTTTGPAPTGQIRFNNATLASATLMYLSDFSAVNATCSGRTHSIEIGSVITLTSGAGWAQFRATARRTIDAANNQITVPVALYATTEGGSGNSGTISTASPISVEITTPALESPFFANVTDMKNYVGPALTCGVQIGTNYHAMCSRKDTSSAWVGSFTSSVTRTTDANGAIYITAADAQMTTILAGIASSVWAAAAGTTAAQWASARVSSNQLQVRVYFSSSATTGTTGWLNTQSVTVYYHVYGVF